MESVGGNVNVTGVKEAESGTVSGTVVAATENLLKMSPLVNLYRRPRNIANTKTLTNMQKNLDTGRRPRGNMSDGHGHRTTVRRATDTRGDDCLERRYNQHHNKDWRYNQRPVYRMQRSSINYQGNYR